MGKISMLGPRFLTVIIRDDGPLVCTGDRPSFRTVQIELSERQREQMQLDYTYSSGGKEFHEQISQAILEDYDD